MFKFFCYNCGSSFRIICFCSVQKCVDSILVIWLRLLIAFIRGAYAYAQRSECGTILTPEYFSPVGHITIAVFLGLVCERWNVILRRAVCDMFQPQLRRAGSNGTTGETADTQLRLGWLDSSSSDSSYACSSTWLLAFSTATLFGVWTLPLALPSLVDHFPAKSGSNSI